MAATYEELIAKAKELAAAGKTEEAKRVAAIAVQRRDQPAQAEQPKSMGQSVKEFFLGDNDPTTQNTGEKIGTWLNKAGEAMTFGLAGDEANAAIAGAIPGGMSYDERLAFERQQEALMKESNPGAMLGAEIAGGVAGALLPGGAIGTLGKGAGTMARIGASTAAGAGMGATYGFMEGEGGAANRAGDALTGGLIGAGAGVIAPAIGAGVQKFADGRAANRAIQEAVKSAPTTADLRAQGRAAYNAIEGAGVTIKPERVGNLTNDIVNALRGEGAAYTGAERVLPGSSAILNAVPEVGAGANTVPFNELDMFRRYANNAAASAAATNPNDARIASGVVERLDDFVMGLKPEDVDSGGIEVLQELLPKARNLWSRMSRSDLIDSAIEAGNNNYLSGSASGVKNQFRRILNNPKLIRGFSEAERKMIQRVVNGTLPEQLVSYLGSGLGMVAQTVAGGAVGAAGGIPGVLMGSAAGAAVGAGARRLTENIVNRNAEIARALVASGRVPQLPVASPANRAIAEALVRRTGAAVPQ